MKLPLLLATLVAVTAVSAQQADPFRAPRQDAPPAPASQASLVSVCFETFSLPLPMAAALRREGMDDAALYARLVAELEKGQSVRQESLTVLRSRSGQKATNESISEMIYPAEYQPPTIPNSVTGATPDPTGGGLPGIQTPSNPTSFETRNTGLSFDVEATVSDSGPWIDLRLAPEIVTFAGRSTWGQGSAKTDMPTFEAQRFNTSATVATGKPFLIGTFNRPPVSDIDADSANRVWFAFVTATVGEP